MPKKISSSSPFSSPVDSQNPSAPAAPEEGKNTIPIALTQQSLEQDDTTPSSLKDRPIDPIADLKDPATAKATQVIQKSFLSNSIAGISQGVLKTLETIAFWKTDLKLIDETCKKKLIDLTGSENMGEFLVKLTPQVVDIIRDSFDEGVLKDFLEGEDAFLNELTETMLLKIASNLAETVKKSDTSVVFQQIKDFKTQGVLKNFAADSPVTIEQMVGFVLKLAGDEYASIEELFNEIELSARTPKEKKHALFALVTPLTNKLLEVLLPGGGSEIPTLPGIRWGVWFFLQKRMIPDLLIDVMKQAKQLQALPNAQQLYGSDTIEVFSLLSSKITASLDATKEEILEKDSLSIAKKIIKSLSEESDAVPSDELEKEPLLEADPVSELDVWLADQIKTLGRSQNSYIQQLGTFAVDRSEAVVVYILQALSEGKQPKDDRSLAAVKAILNSLHLFIANNNDELQALKEDLIEKEQDPLKDEAYIEMFKPLAMEWQQLMRLTKEDEQLPEYLLIASEALMIDTLPKYLATYYDSYLVTIDELYNEGIDVYHQSDVERLKKLLIGAQSKKAGETIQQLENICTLLAGEICPEVKDLIDELISLDPKKPVNFLVHPQLQELWDGQFQDTVRHTLFKIFANNIERSVAKGGLGETPALVLQDILEAVLGNLAITAGSIQKANTIEDQEKRRLVLRQLFKPMAGDLLSILDRGSKEKGIPLPIPSILNREIRKVVEKNFLPDILARVCLKSSSLLSHAEASKAEIVSRQPTSKIPESCRVMAGWVCQFMPGYMGINREEIADDIFTAVGKFLAKKENPTSASVDNYLNKNKDQMQQLLCTVMLGIPNSELVKQAQISSQSYIEALFMHVCNGVSLSLHQIEDPASDKYHPHAVMDLTVKLLQVISAHFAKMNEITKKEKKNSPTEVSYKTMLEGFGKSLHKGVPQTSKSVEANEQSKEIKKKLEEARIHLDKLKKNAKSTPVHLRSQRQVIALLEKRLKTAKTKASEERQTHFYIPFAKKLIDFAQLKQPQEVPNAIWKIVETELLPEFLQDVVDTLLEPQTRNEIVLKILESVDKADETPKASSYQAISAAVENFNNVTLEVLSVEYNAKIYKQTRSLYSAVQFASGNPSDSIVQERWEEMQRILNSEIVDEKIQNAWIKVCEAKEAFLESQRRNKAAKTPYQRKLDKVCGEFFLQLIRTVPHSSLKIFLKLDKFNKLSGEIIGEIIREALVSQGSLLDIFNESLASVASTLTPGEWKENHFVPKEKPKDFVDLTQDEREKLELEKIYQARKDEKLVREKSVEVGAKAISSGFFDSFRTALQKLKELWDRAVDVLFGKHAPWLRQSIRFVGDQLIFRIGGIIFEAWAKPFQSIFNSFTEFYVSYRVNHFVDFMQLDIFEDLVYKLADAAFESLTETPEDSMDPIKQLNELLKIAHLGQPIEYQAKAKG